ncbi:MAG: histidinol-phosphate transaminase [bacterium]
MPKFDLNRLIRKNIRDLKPYISARHEYSGAQGIFLDANENPLGSAIAGDYHRYPDPLQKSLKAKIADIKNIAPEQIFLGNGSDESIDLILRAFCEPGRDHIITMPPTYGMYAVSAAINDVGIIEVPLTKNFEIDTKKVFAAITPQAKLIFLCSPNNPTGNCLNTTAIRVVLAGFPGLVVLDEAYIDYVPDRSHVPYLKKHRNLVILQTFSKAWGLASLRLGMAIASKEIIDTLNKIKPPYNVSVATQQLALEALANIHRKDDMVKVTLEQKAFLTKNLQQFDSVQKIFPSDANFLLVKTADPRRVYEHLMAHQIIVRDRSQVENCTGCLRITVGAPEENQQLISAWKMLDGKTNKNEFHTKNESLILQVQQPQPFKRTAEVSRKTSETDIFISVNLDGAGRYEIQTGLSFFNHMLEQLAKHSSCDLKIQVEGDLHIDEHHTIEDTALALGDAFLKALGDKRGIERYGFLLPMDDALAQVALDFSGRSWLVWKADFQREKIGDVPTEMFYHFFKSFCDTARCNLNIRADGDNEHHKIEAIFKAVGRSMKMAVKRDPDQKGIPSTKGKL